MFLKSIKYQLYYDKFNSEFKFISIEWKKVYGHALYTCNLVHYLKGYFDKINLHFLTSIFALSLTSISCQPKIFGLALTKISA